MDTATAKAVRTHLDATRHHLETAAHIPADLALPILEDAFHNLEAAIDTIRQSRAAEQAERLNLTHLGRAESLAALAGINR